jgi:hypothetical protein
MKTKIVIALFAAAALVSGCDKKEEGGDKGGDEAASGVKECDAYFAAVEKCMSNAPDESKAAFKQGIDQMKQQLKTASDDATKQAVAQGCKAAADALASNPSCK